MPANAPEIYQNDPSTMPRVVGVDSEARKRADGAAGVFKDSVNRYGHTAHGYEKPAVSRAPSKPVKA